MEDEGNAVIDLFSRLITQRNPAICQFRMKVYENEGPLYRLALLYKDTPTVYICYKLHLHPIDLDKPPQSYYSLIWNGHCKNWNGYYNDNYFDSECFDFEEEQSRVPLMVNAALRIHRAFEIFHDTISSKDVNRPDSVPGPKLDLGLRKLMLGEK